MHFHSLITFASCMHGASVIRCDYNDGDETTWFHFSKLEALQHRAENFSNFSPSPSSRINEFACIYWRWRSSGLSRFFSLLLRFSFHFFSFFIFVFSRLFLKNRARQFCCWKLVCNETENSARKKKRLQSNFYVASYVRMKRSKRNKNLTDLSHEQCFHVILLACFFFLSFKEITSGHC